MYGGVCASVLVRVCSDVSAAVGSMGRTGGCRALKRGGATLWARAHASFWTLFDAADSFGAPARLRRRLSSVGCRNTSFGERRRTAELTPCDDRTEALQAVDEFGHTGLAAAAA
eukprot:7234554-Pyramimonas_sp.AAC.1